MGIPPVACSGTFIALSIIRGDCGEAVEAGQNWGTRPIQKERKGIGDIRSELFEVSGWTERYFREAIRLDAEGGFLHFLLFLLFPDAIAVQTNEIQKNFF